MTSSYKNATGQSQLEGLATLLVLNDEVRKLNSLREFGFFVTNETHRLIPYHTAFLFEKNQFAGATILAQSGVPEVDHHTLTSQWLRNKISNLLSSPNAKKIHALDLLKTDTAQQEPPLPEGIFPHCIWCPFFDKSNQVIAGLILSRETAFSEAELKMLSWLIASYQYTWLVLARPKHLPNWRHLQKKPYAIALIFIIIGILLFPIHLSVLATATVIAKDPVLINAPLEGVIKSMAVNPGDYVKKGQLLVSLDKTDLFASLEVSKKDYDLSAAKLRTAVNEGLDKPDSRAEIPILEAQLEVDKAHFDYTQTELQKADIVSPIDGLVIYDSKEDWVGQPVHTGERILIVANPNRVELKIALPVSDVIRLKVGASGDFYSYGQLSSQPIKLKTIGYNAKLMPNKILAYQFYADFNNTNNLPQLGSQGTVRIYGSRVPFIYYLFRKPIQGIRQKYGI